MCSILKNLYSDSLLEIFKLFDAITEDIFVVLDKQLGEHLHVFISLAYRTLP